MLVADGRQKRDGVDNLFGGFGDKEHVVVDHRIVGSGRGRADADNQGLGEMVVTGRNEAADCVLFGLARRAAAVVLFG